MTAADPWSVELERVLEARRHILDELGVDPDELRSRAAEVVERSSRPAPPPVQAAVAFASALHRALVDRGAAPDAAVPVVAEAMRAPWVEDPEVLRSFLRRRYGTDPDAPAAAWSEAAVAFKRRGEAVFGAGFTYEQERLDDEHSWVTISRCYMHDVLGELGQPELVEVFCALDAIVADEFDRVPEYGIEFTQASAMGRGDDICRFRFTRRPTT